MYTACCVLLTLVLVWEFMEGVMCNKIGKMAIYGACIIAFVYAMNHVPMG